MSVLIKRLACVALGMIVFGFLDNSIMILFGNVIDRTIASTLGISTMASAALGNTLSDGFGAALGACIPINEGTDLTVGARVVAHTLGVMLGCLLGMFPLMF